MPVKGSGRGKGLGSPTINVDLSCVPAELGDGVYACFATFQNRKRKAAMHVGPRPVFKEGRSCEVHILDETIPVPPECVDIEVIAYIRPVFHFPSPEALRTQIQADIAQIRTLLL